MSSISSFTITPPPPLTHPPASSPLAPLTPPPSPPLRVLPLLLLLLLLLAVVVVSLSPPLPLNSVLSRSTHILRVPCPTTYAAAASRASAEVRLACRFLSSAPPAVRAERRRS